MGRLISPDAAAGPVAPAMPDHLRISTYADWHLPEDDAYTTTPENAFGVLGTFLRVYRRWEAALDEWAASAGLSRREARALVQRAPDYNLDVVEPYDGSW